MTTLTYKVIKSKAQYKGYCDELEQLVFSNPKTSSDKEKIELLTLLIEKYDEVHNQLNELDPIQLLYALMESNNLKAKDLVEILGVSKGLVSDILNYKKGLSKDLIRVLANHFKISQEALNKTYRLNEGHRSSKSDEQKTLIKKEVASFSLEEVEYSFNESGKPTKGKVNTIDNVVLFNFFEEDQNGDGLQINEEIVDEIEDCKGKVVRFDAYYKEKSSISESIYYKKQ